MRDNWTVSVAAVLLLSSAAGAQTPERDAAIGADYRDYGALVGLDTRFGDVRDEFAVFMGAHAAVLLKHRVYLGIAGAGMVNGPPEIEMGYGGALVGYVVPTPGLVQVTVDALLGGGQVKLADEINDERDEIFVFEPSVGVELKLARILRLGFGASYRFLGGLDSELFHDGDFRTINGTATIRVGWF
jgi:hypothetical protein